MDSSRIPEHGQPREASCIKSLTAKDAKVAEEVQGRSRVPGTIAVSPNCHALGFPGESYLSPVFLRVLKVKHSRGHLELKLPP